MIPFSDLDDGGDLVETAFLVQALICIREYFKDGNAREIEFAEKADKLWKGVEWIGIQMSKCTLLALVS